MNKVASEIREYLKLAQLFRPSRGAQEFTDMMLHNIAPRLVSGALGSELGMRAGAAVEGRDSILNAGPASAAGSWLGLLAGLGYGNTAWNKIRNTGYATPAAVAAILGTGALTENSIGKIRGEQAEIERLKSEEGLKAVREYMNRLDSGMDRAHDRILRGER